MLVCVLAAHCARLATPGLAAAPYVFCSSVIPVAIYIAVIDPYVLMAGQTSAGGHLPDLALLSNHSVKSKAHTDAAQQSVSGCLRSCVQAAGHVACGHSDLHFGAGYDCNCHVVITLCYCYVVLGLTQMPNANLQPQIEAPPTSAAFFHSRMRPSVVSHLIMMIR